MKSLLLACLVMATTACLHKPKPANVNNDITDSVQPVFDTAYNPYSEKDRLNDSLQSVHERDSFLAIKPLARFYNNEKGDAFENLMATLIDTTGIIKTPLHFTDTTIYRHDKDQNIISSLQICKSRQFVIKVFSNWDADPYKPYRLFINGHECRPGIEFDTSLAGSGYSYDIDIDPDDCKLMKFGSKEYLYISANIYHCNGNACSVRYYILYDPLLRKGMVLEQYRNDFISGYDKKTNSPVFLNMYDSWETYSPHGGVTFSGSLYQLNRFDHIQPKLDAKGKQYYFRAYAKKMFDDSIIVYEGNLP